LDILNEIGRSLIAFIFVLGVMIFVHELGHYLMAKWLGIRVDVFSLGFGPRLVGFKRGETDYRISALPLGGYVKMAGENYEDELSGTPDEFLSRPKHHRFAVAVAGPVMNIGLAIVLSWGYYMTGVEVEDQVSRAPVVGRIIPDSAAAKAGIQLNDKILTVDGEKTPTWRELQLAIAKNADHPVDVTLQRNGQTIETEVTPDTSKESEVGTLGVAPFIPYVIRQVEPGAPAEKAGLRAGDTIVEVSAAGKTARDAIEITHLITSQKGKPLQFKVSRGNEVFERTITPVQMGQQHRVGISLHIATHTERYGLIEAGRKSVEHNYRVTVLTFEVLGRILTGRTSLRTMSGPIEIARYSGLAAKEGAIALMSLMAIISLQLGIFNLLPIPILDGGVIALLAIEGLMRRDLSMRVKERIFQIGFIFLILLMGIVIFNDISKHIT